MVISLFLEFLISKEKILNLKIPIKYKDDYGHCGYLPEGVQNC